MNAAVQQQDTSILFPAARVVQGDLYVAQDKDRQGRPLIVKTGPNTGKPRINFFFAIAIPKTPGAQHWANEPWGSKIWALGHSWWPQGQGNSPTFAWKIDDGDSSIPHEETGRKNSETEGMPGHWIVKFSSGFAPKIFDAQGSPLLQTGLVKRGFWVEVFANLQSNEEPSKPGIYINHSMVAYRAPGKEIVSGPDPRSVGFGRSALPAGVTAQPLGNTAHMPSTAAPPIPGATHMPPPVPHTSTATPPVFVAPTPVHPQQSFLQPPVAHAMPPVPAAPTMAPPPPAQPVSVVCPLGAPMGFKMVNLNGPRYEAYRAGGWTDAQIMQANHMVRL